MANSKGYVYRYRLIASEKAGRMLTPEDIVHHKNGDITDDRSDNLAITTRPLHAALHAQERKEGNVSH